MKKRIAILMAALIFSYGCTNHPNNPLEHGEPDRSSDGLTLPNIHSSSKARFIKSTKNAINQKVEIRPFKINTGITLPQNLVNEEFKYFLNILPNALKIELKKYGIDQAVVNRKTNFNQTVRSDVDYVIDGMINAIDIAQTKAGTQTLSINISYYFYLKKTDVRELVESRQITETILLDNNLQRGTWERTKLSQLSHAFSKKIIHYILQPLPNHQNKRG